MSTAMEVALPAELHRIRTDRLNRLRGTILDRKLVYHHHHQGQQHRKVTENTNSTITDTPRNTPVREEAAVLTRMHNHPIIHNHLLHSRHKGITRMPVGTTTADLRIRHHPAETTLRGKHLTRVTQTNRGRAPISREPFRRPSTEA